MQFTTVSVIAFLAAGALAMPNQPAGEQAIKARCEANLPACNGGHVVGQTNCRCQGQVETCDLWSCPGGGNPNTAMVCGQQGSGCVWI
ncbi:hypothetical protein PG985_014253 [Apiospora marii]|uniref:Signal peptide-containing protein n=1 Tax=Apiospora marii TaxID=335849 RepID=A0ABR1R6A3_9PEZI